MSTISAGIGSTTGLVYSSDTTGQLNLEAYTGIVNLGSNTGAAVVPKGTTAQRPAVPTNGMIRYNTDTARFEGYNNGWVAFT